MKNIIFCILLFYSTVIFSQGEPWKRPLKICRSSDGTNFTGIQTFQDSSGVPNVIKLPSGNLAAVFQWFRQPVGSPSWDRVAVKFSSNNGINWTEPTPIVVNGLPGNFTRPFDPTLAITDNNRIRIFFSSGLNMILDTSINTYSAISDDGINYTFENGIRFSMPDRPVLDPAVIKFRNLWHLANPISNMTISGAFHNISNDGINFTRVQDINSDATHSWIGNYMINDTNELRFYGSGMNVWFSSSPNGGEWSAFNSTNIQGGDPSVLRLSSNDYLMIYTGQPYAVNIQVTGNSVPDKFELFQNYPNPFNPATNLEFGIPDLGFVSLKVYDVLGHEVKTLVNENKPAGRYEVTFNGTGLPSGVYFYRLVVSPSNSMESGVFRDIKRMVLIK